MRNLGRDFRRILVISGTVAFLGVGIAFLHAQNGRTPNSGASTPTASQQDQSIPDAPSTVQPAKPLPTPQPSTQTPPSSAPSEQPQAPPQQAPAQEAPEQAPPANENATPPQGTNQKPPVNIRTVPEGGATRETAPGEDDIPTIIVQTNQVVIPVTVTDEAGHLVPGLTAKDFTVLENGKKQKLNLFTSDPFAISAAVIIDLGMKDVDLQKVNRTFPALEGAFSAFDELAIYTYSNTVSRLTGWGAVGPALTAKLDELESVRGENNGPPVTSGPMAAGGPVINGVPVDPGQPRTIGAPQPARVMNDAILRAATDLAKRDKTRRKVIFVISDGREYRSNASYRDVLRVLLSNNIMVYALGVSSGVPGYRTLSKLHLPRFGYSDILPKYVNATTGGQVFNEMTRTGIEDAYSEAMGNARNQYTLGYKTNLPPSGGYRTFEVLVDRPSCRSSIRPCVNVEAPDGYYPTPPVR